MQTHREREWMRVIENRYEIHLKSNIATCDFHVKNNNLWKLLINYLYRQLTNMFTRTLIQSNYNNNFQHHLLHVVHSKCV